MNQPINQNELVLSPGEYILTQDITTGMITCFTGPNVMQAGSQVYPVVYDQKTSRFRRVGISEAVQPFATAQQGQYVVLSNPAQDGKQPEPRDKKAAPMLNHGQKVILQGPITFALWPGQSAEVVDGHNLRSNQYLKIRIRDEQAARDNWLKGVIKTVGEGSESNKKSTLFSQVPADLAVGKHYIVRGDEFSFYIPPTGVDVVRDENGSYVRDAVSLERLEYSILIDENGTKRYERGPKVVFPSPTERFLEQKDKEGKSHVVFQPIELNEIQGLHVKVISDYTDGHGTQQKEGEELFITGDKTPIYFPRAEHSVVSYDRKHKHFATAVPAGEGRYVLERKSGMINTVEGPTMLLPDPRSQVIVRRVLSDKEVRLMYPGNLEAERYNAALRELSRGTSSTRGAVSEGEVTRSKKIRSALTNDTLGFADRSTTHSETFAVGAEEFERAATYQEPRTLTLDTKFSGVPAINVWTGYAVMIVSADPNADVKRRVEIGPKRVLLKYDETLETLSLSTGKPKNTDTLMQTAYLRVKNNQVGDVIVAETSDHVRVEFKVSLRGDFEGESTKWFDAENYVKLVSDHVRSVVKAAVRLKTIKDIYADPTGMVRDAILGQKGGKGDKRPGMVFEENGFHVVDVDVLGFTVGDATIAKILDAAQHTVVESNIGLDLSQKKLEIDQQQEQMVREREKLVAETARMKASMQAELQAFNATLAAQKIARDLEVKQKELDAKIEELRKEEMAQAEAQKLLNEKMKQELDRKKSSADVDQQIATAAAQLELNKLKEQTNAVTERFKAASGPFAEALVALGSQETMAKVAEAMSIQRMIGGPNLVDAIKSVFAGTPIADMVVQTAAKALPTGKPTNGGSTGFASSKI